MPTNTPNINIPKPLGTETVSRSAFNAIWDLIDGLFSHATGHDHTTRGNLIPAAALAADVAPAILATPTVTGLLTLSGGQIRFPAVQVASADPNTLDDYEEGDWTGDLVPVTSGSIVMYNQFKTGAYTKKGREVTVTGNFRVYSVSSPVGDLNLTGLPFTSSAGEKCWSAAAVFVNVLEATATTEIMGLVVAGVTHIRLNKFAAGSMAPMAADVKANTDLIVSATYFI